MNWLARALALVQGIRIPEFGLIIAGIAQAFTFPLSPSNIIVFLSILCKLLRGESRGEGVAILRDIRFTVWCSHTGFAF